MYNLAHAQNKEKTATRRTCRCVHSCMYYVMFDNI